jgi:hypothetical protein
MYHTGKGEINMYNSSIRGIAMSTKELKDIAIFFKNKGISPTIMELCSKSVASLYLTQYRTERMHA